MQIIEDRKTEARQTAKELAAQIPGMRATEVPISQMALTEAAWEASPNEVAADPQGEGSQSKNPARKRGHVAG